MDWISWQTHSNKGGVYLKIKHIIVTSNYLIYLETINVKLVYDILIFKNCSKF